VTASRRSQRQQTRKESEFAGRAGVAIGCPCPASCSWFEYGWLFEVARHVERVQSVHAESAGRVWFGLPPLCVRLRGDRGQRHRERHRGASLFSLIG